MEGDVGQDAAAKEAAAAEDGAGLSRLDSLQRAAKPRLEGESGVGLEHERDRGTGCRTGDSRPRARPPRERSNEPTSMNTGREPRHWTLYGDASFRIMSSASAARSSSSSSRAASRSIEKGPLVGVGDERDPLVTRASRQLESRRRERLGRVVEPLGGDDPAVALHLGEERVPVRCSQSSRPRAESARRMSSPSRKTRLSGSLNDPDSAAGCGANSAADS